MKIWYTYLIGWKELDVWYYGYRGAVSPKDDLWIEYFTSSKYVARFRELNGEPDVILVDKEFKSKKEAQHYEDAYLAEKHAVQSENWLNRSRAGKEFRSPDTFSEKSREKMRQARIRNGNTRKKPFTEQERENARKQLQRINSEGLRAPWTAERRQKISEKAVGNQARKGMTNSKEHRRKISEAKKKLSNVRCSCVSCKREMTIIGMRKHLATVCSADKKIAG